jgi:hypothetical protein
MSTKTLEKLVKNLSKEVIQLRSFVISVAGRDPEGDYRPEFVRKMKKISSEKPVLEYTDRGSLLKLLKQKK